MGTRLSLLLDALEEVMLLESCAAYTGSVVALFCGFYAAIMDDRIWLTHTLSASQRCQQVQAQ